MHRLFIIASTALGLLLSPLSASAELTAEQENLVGDASFIDSATITVTPEQYAINPIPGCIPWVRFAVKVPDGHWVPLTVVYNIEGRGSPYLLVSTPLKDRRAFSRATRDFFHNWMVKLEPIFDRRADLSRIVRLKSRFELSADLRTQVGTVMDSVREHGADALELRCTRLPAWMARAYPFIFSEARMYGISAVQGKPF